MSMQESTLRRKAIAMRFSPVWIILLSAALYLGLQVYPVWTILLLALLAAIAWVYKRKRAMTLKGVAPSLGFSYQRDAALDDIDVFSLNFHLFRQGDSKRIKNVMSGQRDGIAIRIFEYPNNRTMIFYAQYATVLLLQSHKLDLPTFELRPKGLHHKIGGWFGQQGIHVDPHPAFSAMSLLQGADEQAIRALFTHDMLSYFAKNNDICVVGWSHTLLVYRAGQCVSPHRMASFLEEGLRIFALFTTP